MVYAYARVSSKEQNEARQIDAFAKAGITGDAVYVDHESGKDFDRTKYQALRRILTKGDTLVVLSLDRFGRSYDAIIDEWRYLTKTVGCNIKVLDMPLLDTTQGEGLIGKFVSDIVLQILSFVAETERRNIKERQRQGIASAHVRGVKFGRPRAKTDGLEALTENLVSGKMTKTEAARILGVSGNTVARRLRDMGIVIETDYELLARCRYRCCECPCHKNGYCSIYAKRVSTSMRACDKGVELIRRKRTPGVVNFWKAAKPRAK